MTRLVRGMLVSAWGLVLACVLAAVLHPPVVDAYVLGCCKWGTLPITILHNPTNGEGISTSNMTAALRAGVDPWIDQTDASFSYTWGSTVSDTTSTFDQRNVLLVASTTNPNNAYSIASTYCWAAAATYLFLDCDTVLWGGYATFKTSTQDCSGSNAAHVSDIAAHEVGHIIGLQHSSVNGATMAPGYGCTAYGTWTSLSADDIGGIQFLYPPTSEPPPPPPPPEPDPAPVTTPTLSVRAYKVKGVQHADLKWAGLTTAVDIYRSNARIVQNSPNDGAHTDNIGKKGGGSYTYRVCPTGTTAGCTNNAQAVF